MQPAPTSTAPPEDGPENPDARLSGISRLIRHFVFVPAILVIIALLTVNIVDRYLLDGLMGIVWLEELCVIIMIWLIFTSVFAVNQDDLHIKVQLIRFKPWIAELIEDVAVLAFVAFLMWSTWGILPRLFSKYAALGWSIKVGYYAIIAGGAVAIIAKLAKYLMLARRKWR